MNPYFLSAAEAQRYSQSRINFYPYVASKIVNYLNLALPIPLVVDVGCGTGHSTLAFAQYAEKIIGIDQSEEMLKLAPQNSKISYQKLKAEEINLLNVKANFVVAGQSFHWFERKIFFKNCSQIISKNGFLVILTNTLEHKELDSLNKDFPPVFKSNNQFIEEAEIFSLMHVDRFSVDEEMVLTKDCILRHLRTLSSVEAEFQKNPTQADLMLNKYWNELSGPSEITIRSKTQVWILNKR